MNDGRVREDSPLGPSDLGMVLFVCGLESELRYFFNPLFRSGRREIFRKWSEFVFLTFYLYFSISIFCHVLTKTRGENNFLVKIIIFRLVKKISSMEESCSTRVWMILN